MQMINWAPYWALTAVLAILYYSVIYILWFKRKFDHKPKIKKSDEESEQIAVGDDANQDSLLT